MLWKLELHHGGHFVEAYELTKDVITIGRDDSRDIVIEDLSVSRKHARLTRTEGTYTIQDTQSRNGVFVNGQPIYSAVLLKDGDHFAICDREFTLRSREGGAQPDAEDLTSTVLTSIEAASSARDLIEANATEKLRAVLHIARALGPSLDEGTMLQKMLDGLFNVFPDADRGLVLLMDDGGLTPRAAKHRSARTDNLPYSRTIVQRAIDSGEAILCEDTLEDSRFLGTESIADYQIRSAMCAPLLSTRGSRWVWCNSTDRARDEHSM